MARPWVSRSEGQEREGKAQPAWGVGMFWAKTWEHEPFSAKFRFKSSSLPLSRRQTEATDPAAAVVESLPPSILTIADTAFFSGEGSSRGGCQTILPCHSTNVLATDTGIRIFSVCEIPKVTLAHHVCLPLPVSTLTRATLQAFRMEHKAAPQCTCLFTID